MYEIKTEDVYEDFGDGKEIYDFINYWTRSNYYHNSKKLVVGKMKDETAGVAIEEFLGFNPKMYSHLVNAKSELKKGKSVNKNVVATISHNKYKDVLLSKKCLTRSINRIQSKDHKMGTYKISKISFSCFDNKIYIQNNGYDGLALKY